MRYLGGKKAIAKQLAEAIRSRTSAVRVWEPFCGGFGATVELARLFEVHASDRNASLIEMWKAVREGWDPPRAVTRDQWEAAKALPEGEPLKTFIGYAASFGGIYFGSYAFAFRRNIAGEARRNVLRSAHAPKWLEVEDFLQVEPVRLLASCIYCDPPYFGTSGYGKPFDHERFWQLARAWQSHGVPVFVSEYSAPDDWVCVWEQRRTMNVRKTMVADESRDVRTERLFVHSSVVDAVPVRPREWLSDEQVAEYRARLARVSKTAYERAKGRQRRAQIVANYERRIRQATGHRGGISAMPAACWSFVEHALCDFESELDLTPLLGDAD